MAYDHGQMDRSSETVMRVIVRVSKKYIQFNSEKKAGVFMVKRWAWTLIVTVLLMAAVPARSEQATFAYVDVPRALSSSEASKKATAILQKKLEEKQREVDAMKEELKKMREDLDKRSAVLNSEARSELAGKIRRKFRDLQRLLEENQAALDQENSQWTKRMNKELQEVVEEIGRERGFTIVFSKTPMLIYVNTSIDITNEVLTRFNERTQKWF